MQTKLLEIFQIGSERAGILDIPEQYWPDPGQYLPCQRIDGFSGQLTTQLFQIISNESILSLSPLPESWQPGDQLLIVSPQGKGFSLPGEARRVALLPYKVPPTRLLVLVKQAVSQNASISLFCETIPTGEIMNRLPSIVEVNPTNALLENLDWPDFLAVDIARDDLEDLSGLFNQETSNIDGQVLVRAQMPCRGLGECGVCAIKTTKGLRYTCSDGPVFPLKELLHVAQ